MWIPAGENVFAHCLQKILCTKGILLGFLFATGSLHEYRSVTGCLLEFLFVTGSLLEFLFVTVCQHKFLSEILYVYLLLERSLQVFLFVKIFNSKWSHPTSFKTSFLSVSYALDDLPSTDKKGPPSIRQPLEPFRRQQWEISERHSGAHMGLPACTDTILNKLISTINNLLFKAESWGQLLSLEKMLMVTVCSYSPDLLFLF